MAAGALRVKPPPACGGVAAVCPAARTATARTTHTANPQQAQRMARIMVSLFTLSPTTNPHCPITHRLLPQGRRTPTAEPEGASGFESVHPSAGAGRAIRRAGSEHGPGNGKARGPQGQLAPRRHGEPWTRVRGRYPLARLPPVGREGRNTAPERLNRSEGMRTWRLGKVLIGRRRYNLYKERKRDIPCISPDRPVQHARPGLPRSRRASGFDLVPTRDNGQSRPLHGVRLRPGAQPRPRTRSGRGGPRPAPPR